MTNPTSNFGWQMPESTDLVTNLPADFEVFGQAVDTDFADLLGGTTGQVLKKNTNADLDFVWGADSAGMTNPMTTTGDTIYSSSGSTPARLGIGSAGQVLTVASGVPSWASPAGGGKVLQVVNYVLATTATLNSGSYVTTGVEATITPTLNTSKILVIAQLSGNGSVSSANNSFFLSLFKNSTNLANPTSPGSRTPAFCQWFKTYGAATGQDSMMFMWNFSFLDSPATTSATTYSVKYAGESSNPIFEVNRTSSDTNAGYLPRATSNITLLEIGA